MIEPDVVSAIKKYIGSLPDVKTVSGEYRFVPDGCTSDVIGYDFAGKIKYIVECKGSTSPGVIAGGIGQAYQYEYQKRYDKNVAKDSGVYFACPIDMRAYLDFMEIPKQIKSIFLVNQNKTISIYNTSKKKNNNNILQIAGTAYLEATSIELITLSIETLVELEEKKRNKRDFEDIMKLKYPKIKDHRNTLITPRSLGLVDRYELTPKGYSLYSILKRNKEEYKNELIKLLYPSLMVVTNALVLFVRDSKKSLHSFTFTTKDLESKIIEIYGGEVNYFDFRRLSSPIKILQEIGVLTINKDSSFKLNNLIII